MSEKKATTIGGQALIEGIMMKGPNRTVVAVREPNKNIYIEDLPETNLKEKFKVLGLPIIRGAAALVQSMKTGYKALMLSADKSGMTAMEEEEELELLKAKSAKEAAKSGEDEQAVFERLEAKEKKKENSAFMGILMAVASVLGVVIAMLLFMWLPTFLFNLLKGGVGEQIAPWRAVFEGILKMIIFVSYIALVSRMNDIKRVFMYHGAEHKTIFCYEHGEELSVPNVRKQSRFHPRCGTSFMILMLIVSVVFYAAVSLTFPVLANSKLWVILKILLMPVICGLGYELIRICGRYNNIVTRIISAPGMWLQRLTTKEPEDVMIEVAIESLKAVIPEDKNADVF